MASKSRIVGELARQFCSSFNARQETNSARPSISHSNRGDEILKAERTTASNPGSHPGSKGARSPVGHTPVDLLYEKGIQRTFAKLLAELDPVEILGTVVYVVLNIWGKSDDLVLPFWLFVALLAGYHALARPILRMIFRID